MNYKYFITEVTKIDVPRESQFYQIPKNSGLRIDFKELIRIDFWLEFMTNFKINKT